jgi:exopolysaccharide biosynthesis polyprenyl glycosylphosphotransferase
MPLAHEPLLYVEAPSLSKAQLVAKRMLDVVLSSLALLVLSPVIAMVALGIKINDRGPIFFSQKRVGRRGREFGVLKFRSMRVDAEKQLALLKATNERQGPLFKMENDPRVTRIGRFLRDSSLDELPQLINVLRGEMSLVGPRPALASEVANFPVKLRAREQVMPGITGLWQVEARDNPSFEAYRRLDLFYVENWSITLDLLIIVGTMEQVVSRMLSTMVSRHKKTETDVDPGPEALARP